MVETDVSLWQSRFHQRSVHSMFHLRSTTSGKMKLAHIVIVNIGIASMAEKVNRSGTASIRRRIIASRDVLLVNMASSVVEASRGAPV